MSSRARGGVVYMHRNEFKSKVDRHFALELQKIKSRTGLALELQKKSKAALIPPLGIARNLMDKHCIEPDRHLLAN